MPSSPSSSPNFIILCDGGSFFTYNLLTHKLYEISEDDVAALKSLSAGSANTALDNLGFKPTDPHSTWHGHLTSAIAHKGSRIYSHNTQPLSPAELARSYTDMSNASTAIPARFCPDGPSIGLPPPSLDALENTSLAECFRTRKTSRSFDGSPITMEQLSTLLYSCFGHIHTPNTELDDAGFINSSTRRSSPSATGLASCDGYVWANHVLGLESGLYFYHMDTHTLVKLPLTMTPQTLTEAMLDQYWCQDLSAGLFIVNDMRLSWAKDHSCRAYIASHQEAGHLSQNILLAATALGLHTWLSGTFRDDKIDNVLQLPGYRFTSLFVGIGHGDGSMIPKGYTDFLQKD